MKIAFLDWSHNGITRAENLSSRPLGGRVTCLQAVSRYLSSEQGHDVTCIMPGIPEPFYVGAVKWTTRFENEGLDWLVFLRGPGDGASGIKATRRALWVRDLPHSGYAPDPLVLRDLSFTAFLSDYAERIWRTYYREHIGASVTIPNGVDKDLFQRGLAAQFDQRLILYASAPNRGLDKLPLIFESLREIGERPFMVAFSNLEALHPGEVSTTEDFGPVYDRCREAGIDLRDPVPQEELAGYLKRAAFLLKPNGYPEICSNLELQALACGCPIVTTGGLGSTPEWVQHGVNGLLTTFGPWDYMVHSVELTRYCRDLLRDQQLRARLARGALETNVLSWEEVGEKWHALLSS